MVLCLNSYFIEYVIRSDHCYPSRDPGSYPDIEFLNVDFQVLCILSLYSSPLGLGLFLFHKLKKIPVPKAAWVYLLGLVLVLVQFFWDPFYILPWYLD